MHSSLMPPPYSMIQTCGCKPCFHELKREFCHVPNCTFVHKNPQIGKHVCSHGNDVTHKCLEVLSHSQNIGIVQFTNQECQILRGRLEEKEKECNMLRTVIQEKEKAYTSLQNELLEMTKLVRDTQHRRLSPPPAPRKFFLHNTKIQSYSQPQEAVPPPPPFNTITSRLHLFRDRERRHDRSPEKSPRRDYREDRKDNNPYDNL